MGKERDGARGKHSTREFDEERRAGRPERCFCYLRAVLCVISLVRTQHHRVVVHERTRMHLIDLLKAALVGFDILTHSLTPVPSVGDGEALSNIHLASRVVESVGGSGLRPGWRTSSPHFRLRVCFPVFIS